MAKPLPYRVLTGVAMIGDHELRLLWDDGTVGDVSFKDDSWDGVFAPLRDPSRFAKVTIDMGTLCWPEDGLDWAPEPLYAATRANRLTPASAAAT